MTSADLHRVELTNGFRALLVSRRSLPVVATVLHYEVGSRDERSGETGLSHFLEHMMFKGTDRYAKGEIDLLTSRMGGSNNAFTDCDGTAYYFSLPSDRWQSALEIEASRMSDCSLDPDEFTAEKSVVLEELAMGEDDPWRSLLQTIETVSYQVHPYHHPVIGWREDLERLEVGTMRSYYERHYGANRAFMVAVGDFDVAEVGDRVEELFGDQRRAQPRAPVLSEPDQLQARRGVIRAPGDIPRLAMACRTCRMGERDDFVLDVLSHVLGSGRSSRLYDRLITREQIATDITVWNETRLDPGLFWVALELHPGSDLERAEAMVREELEELCRGGLRRGELRRARTQILSSYLFEDETVLDAALKIARFEALAKAGAGLLDEVEVTYGSITAAEVAKVARRHLQGDRWDTVLSVPEGAERARRRPGRKAR